MNDRVPPHDLDAEKSLLGAMMLSEKMADEMATALDASDFYRNSHALIFRAVTSLRSRNEPCDVVAVASELADDLERAGGKGYLLDVVNATPFASSAPKYAAIVKAASRRRDVIEAAVETMADAYTNDDADEVESRALQRISAAQHTAGHSSQSLRSLIESELEALKTPAVGIRFPSFADILFEPGDLVVLGARPKHGKSAWGANVGLDWSLEGKTLFLSYEMTSARIVRRMISRFTGLSSADMNRGLCDGDVRIARSFMESAKIDERDFNLKYCPGLSPQQLFSTLRRFAAMDGKYVVLDYVQLAAQPRSGRMREDVAVFSNQLKQAVGDSGLTCLALSQLKRPDDSHTLTMPGSTDLKESGSLEQDADAVFLMMTLPSLRDPVLGEKASEFASKRLARYDLPSESLEKDEYHNHDKRICFIEAELVRSGEPDRKPFVFDGSVMSFSEVPERLFAARF